MTSERTTQHGRRHLLARVLFACAAAALAAAPAAAEHAWVKDELRIEVRTGPGTKYRILGYLKTGDGVEIVSRAEKWTEVRPSGMEPGWIPTGYLQPTAPARIALVERDSENARLKAELTAVTESETRLRTANDEIGSRDESQQAEITRLTRENLELRAGARWPEWITGGGIVLVGMILGAAVSRSSGRRRPQRIRL